MDANLLGELPLVEPGVPELTNELIDLGLIATPARALDVMHPSLSPGLHRIGNHGVHRTLTVGQSLQVKPSLIGYMPFVPQGLHISTWETAKPRRFGYVPFVPQGLHVSTWETAQPRRFGYVPFVPNGLFVESK